MAVNRLKFSHLVYMGIAMICMVLCLGPTAISQEQDPDNIGSNWTVVEWNGMEVVDGHVMIQFNDRNSTQAERSVLHQELNNKVLREVAEGLDLVKIETAVPLGEMINLYQNDPSVEYAEPNMAYRTYHTPNDSSYGNQWQYPKIQMPNAWNNHKGGNNAVVAILDTGVDVDHSDLADDMAYDYDFLDGDSNANDVDGHGSWCCGAAGGETNNGLGVASVSYDCKFWAFRCGTGPYVYSAASVSAINYVRNNGGHVISMSWGGGSQDTSIKNALLNAHNQGVINVAAAGNDGNTAKDYPAGYDHVMAVAASTSSDGRASFSNYGTWVSVAAPGSNVLSTWKNNQYAWADGTSMACPIAAGACCLLYDKIGGSRTTTNRDIVISALEDNCVSKSWVVHGRIDVNAAILDLAPPTPPAINNVSPGSVQAVGGGQMTLTGTGFGTVTDVKVNSVSVTFTIVSDTQITYNAPVATALGSAAVRVWNGGGASNISYFTFTETNPPKDISATWADSGGQFSWVYGAGPGDAVFLLVDKSNASFNYNGYDILLDIKIFHFQYLNSAGVGGKTVNIPASPSTWTYYHQILVFDTPTEAFMAATDIKTLWIF